MTYRDVIDFLRDEILSITGSVPDDWELHFADTKNVDAHTLDWDSALNILKISCPGLPVIIRVTNAKLSIAKLGRYFFDNVKKGIHPTAIIEQGAQIGKECYIGPYVVIHSCAIIGNGVSINAGSVIGNRGFGFVKDENGDLLRFPQIGVVIIKDGVEIGSNTTIDRGALSNTTIGRNSKINNLVHIAHNVHIGENVVVTAHVNISGSVCVGDNVWIGPGTTIRDHVVIGANAYIGIGSNVTKDIPMNQVWYGNPAKQQAK